MKLSTSKLQEGENTPRDQPSLLQTMGTRRGRAGKVSAASLPGCSPKQVPPASSKPDTGLDGLWSQNNQSVVD